MGASVTVVNSAAEKATLRVRGACLEKAVEKEVPAGTSEHAFELVGRDFGKLAVEISRLKQQAGEPILAHGGASFARSLVRERLPDEYWLLVYPVALGRGLPLFTELEKPLDLKLVRTTTFDGGVVEHIYRPA